MSCEAQKMEKQIVCNMQNFNKLKMFIFECIKNLRINFHVNLSYMWNH